MYLSDGGFELCGRRGDDIVGEGLQFVGEFRVEDLDYTAALGGYLGLMLWMR